MDYSTTFKLDDDQPQTTNTLTFTIADDAELEVVNTLGMIIPTGVDINLSLSIIASLLTAAFILAFIVWCKKGIPLRRK